MIFIFGKKDLLVTSKYHNPKLCWNYPLDELDYVVNSNNNQRMIYMIGEDKRIYETLCKEKELKDFYNTVDGKPDFRRFELITLSICITMYIKFGIQKAEEYLEDWNKKMEDYEPNSKLIYEKFNEIITPMEEKKLSSKQHKDTINKIQQDYAEKEYIMFVLGYDLLNEELSNTSDPECDMAYEKCKNIAEDFLNSKYNDSNKSLYDCLVDYIEDEKYIKFIYEDNESLEKGD